MNNKTEDGSTLFSCALATPELQKYKAGTITLLKEKIIERKELKDGYAFHFPADNQMLDVLVDFIKTEKKCCGFFTLTLSVNGEKDEIWLKLTGRKGVKEFIQTELDTLLL